MHIPFTASLPICVAGPTNSGKTYWIKKLLKADNMFTKPVKSILYSYAVDQPAFEQMKNEITTPIRFMQGIPSREDLEEIHDGGFHVIVLDDQMEEIVNNVFVQNLFTKYCHHYNITAIFITQNIFAQGSKARNISLQVQYYVLFANNRDTRQIRTLAGQVASQAPKAFVEAFTDATSRQYGYLVVDCSPYSTTNLRWQSNIFSDEKPTIVYQPKDESV